MREKQKKDIPGGCTFIGDKGKIHVTRGKLNAEPEILDLAKTGLAEKLYLISTTDFKDDGRMTLEEYPPVGAVLEALVLGPNEHQRQMRLGVKPSHLGRERGTS